MADSETYCYQQIVLNLPEYGMSFEEFKNVSLGQDGGRNPSWRGFYRYLSSSGMLQLDVDVPEESLYTTYSVSAMPMSDSQQRIFDTVTYKIKQLNDNLHWIVGGAGTGKSFLLAKFSEHFNQLGYHVERLAPTGVAAYNVHGQTVDRFFGLTMEQPQINKMKLNDHVKLYKKTVLLIDEFSMLTRGVIEAISSALIQVTGVNGAFGGMAVIFFGDLAQLLPPKSKDFVWKSKLFLQGQKYSLVESMRQMGDERFQDILQMVRQYILDDDERKVANFIKERARMTPPINCVRLYTRNAMARSWNRDAIDMIPGELMTFKGLSSWK